MSDGEPTKTVVVANDVHKAVRVYAERKDLAIQRVVDRILRGDDDLQSAVMSEYRHLEQAGDLPAAE